MNLMLPKLTAFAEKIEEAIPGCMVYIVGGALRDTQKCRDVDMVVMGACHCNLGYLLNMCLHADDATELCTSSDPEDYNQKDAKVIFRFHDILDVPVELSFPRNDCDSNIFRYMREAYPLSAQEICQFISGGVSHGKCDMCGTEVIYVKTWLNYQNAYKKYKRYYPLATFVECSSLEEYINLSNNREANEQVSKSF